MKYITWGCTRRWGYCWREIDVYSHKRLRFVGAQQTIQTFYDDDHKKLSCGRDRV